MYRNFLISFFSAIVFTPLVLLSTIFVGAQDHDYPLAVGGTESVIEQNGKYYRVHTFTQTGTSTLEVVVGGNFEYLVVAGGGGGGGGQTGSFPRGGGGGAGGLLQGSANVVSGSYSIVVGEGGLGTNTGDHSSSEAGEPGGNSSVFDIIAIGGGGGATRNDQTFGGDGGSGGGGTQNQNESLATPGQGVIGQGFEGGEAISGLDGRAQYGGGGGAGEPGYGAGHPTKASYGGDGLVSNISGVEKFYAGGGGGGGQNVGIGGLGGGGTGGNSSIPATSASSNSGGGGGGGNGPGGNGGSGIVIVRYEIAAAEYFTQAGAMSGDQYMIQSSSVNFGGGYSESDIFSLKDTLGEVATGISDSENFELRAGYRQLLPATISVSGIDTVVMDNILSGVTGGVSLGSTTVTVVTDNQAGYELFISTESSPAMRGPDGAVIGNYQPSGVADFMFATSSTMSHLALSVNGVDAVERFRHNAMNECGVGESNTLLRCWTGLQTNLEPIARGTSSNHPNGSETTLYFKVGVGNEVAQPPGVYVATTTVTALPL